MKNRNIANINTDLKTLLKHWLGFTKPFHNLSKKEQEVLAVFLFYYFILKKEIKNEDLVWKVLFDYDIKLNIKKELNDLPDYSMQNYLSAFRRKGVIKDNKIYKTYIPNIEFDSNTFQIIYNFKILNNND